MFQPHANDVEAWCKLCFGRLKPPPRKGQQSNPQPLATQPAIVHKAVEPDPLADSQQQNAGFPMTLNPGNSIAVSTNQGDVRTHGVTLAQGQEHTVTIVQSEGQGEPMVQGQGDNVSGQGHSEALLVEPGDSIMLSDTESAMSGCESGPLLHVPHQDSPRLQSTMHDSPRLQSTMQDLPEIQSKVNSRTVNSVFPTEEGILPLGI